MKIKIGTRFNYSYADANPTWEVKSSRGGGTWVCEIVDCEDYAGKQKLFDTKEIQGSIGMSQMFDRVLSESNDFFANLSVGSIVHYRDGFQKYVRCEVTKDKQLMPIALVGKWDAHELPQRLKNGSIYESVHVRWIRTKKLFSPNASNVYEYNVLKKKSNQPIGFDRDINPSLLKPISLTVPEMTDEQRKEADLWQKIGHIKNALDIETKNPIDILNRIKELI